MKEINVTGQKRSDLGKKATKMLRKEGLIPCNIYGEKKGENGLPEAKERELTHAHNNIMHMLAECGIIGVSALLIFWLTF